MNIRRILVALDASPHSLAALEAAVAMAARAEAELVGIFVEDVDLLHLAEMPFAREIGCVSGLPRPLSNDAVKRIFKITAARAHQALAASANKAGVAWSFRVARGAVVTELLRAASDADLLALGTASQALSTKTRLGSTAFRVLSQSPRNVLLLHRGTQIQPPILIALSIEPSSRQCLPTAVELCFAAGGNGVVLLPANDGGTTLREEAAALFAARNLQPRFRRLTEPSLAAIARAAREECAGTLLLAGSESDWPREELASLLEAVQCPILLVRP